LVSVILLFVLSGFFRGFDIAFLQGFNLEAPEWLIDLHKLIGYEVK